MHLRIYDQLQSLAIWPFCPQRKHLKFFLGFILSSQTQDPQLLYIQIQSSKYLGGLRNFIVQILSQFYFSQTFFYQISIRGLSTIFVYSLLFYNLVLRQFQHTVFCEFPPTFLQLIVRLSLGLSYKIPVKHYYTQSIGGLYDDFIGPRTFLNFQQSNLLYKAAPYQQSKSIILFFFYDYLFLFLSGTFLIYTHDEDEDQSIINMCFLRDLYFYEYFSYFLSFSLSFFDFIEYDFECIVVYFFNINVYYSNYQFLQLIAKFNVINEIRQNIQFMIESNTQKVDKQPQLVSKPKVVIVPPKTQHKNTIIWIHGLHQYPQKYLFIFNDPIFDTFKIIAPEAPTRFVTIQNKQVTSWFDIKFRSEKSFIVPFDEAFSSAEVIDSYEKYLKPLIYKARQELDLLTQKGKLIIAGFSQGCGMSFHSFYKENDKIDAVIGLSGYLFPITPFKESEKFQRVLYGKIDDLRPWQYVKVTYEGKIANDKITLVENTKHEINQQVAKQFQLKIKQLMNS